MRQRDGERKRAEIVRSSFEGVRARLDGVNAQLDELRGDVAKLDAKPERRTKTLGDAVAATGKRIDDRAARHERRLARLESRRPARR